MVIEMEIINEFGNALVLLSFAVFCIGAIAIVRAVVK